MVWSSARRKRPARNASAKLVPSAEMPKPENIRRMVTGPKSANRSIRKSRSMRGPRPYPLSRLKAGTTTWLNRRRLELHRLAAAAGRDLVRVVEDELRLHPVGLVV